MALANDIEFSTAALLKITTETEELNERLDRLFAHYRKNNIFILDQSYSYSSWRFGLAFKFFNCFGKEIKYIEITVCAYNQVGDRQRDDPWRQPDRRDGGKADGQGAGFREADRDEQG